jgi:hypothetical protein
MEELYDDKKVPTTEKLLTEGEVRWYYSLARV